MLLDSNIIIYAARGEFRGLPEFVHQHGIAVSAASRIEVYGYPGLSGEDKTTFDRMFQNLITFPVNEEVIEQAIRLRQIRRMSLGDSIIAATALCQGLPLATRNTADFDWIDGVNLVNPVDNP